MSAANGLGAGFPSWRAYIHQNGVMVEQAVTTLPGNYPAYYAAVRDALQGKGENPVPAAQAIQVMELIELGLLSHQERRAVMVKNQ